MAKLTIIAGLPGAGKSTYIEQHHKDFDAVYNDYFGTQFASQKNFSIHDNKNPMQNERFSQLVKDLIEEKRVAVDDIVFGIAKHRNSFMAAVIQAVPDVELAFVFFSPSVEASKKNVTSRNRGENRVVLEHKLIDEISQEMTILESKLEPSYDA